MLSGISRAMRSLPVFVLFCMQFLPLKAQTTDIASAILPLLPGSGVNSLTYQQHTQRNDGSPSVRSDTTVSVTYTFHDAVAGGDSTIYPIFKLVTGSSGERDSSHFNIIVHHAPEKSVTFTDDSLWKFGYPFLRYFPYAFIPGDGDEVFLGNGFPGSVPDSLFGAALPDSLVFRIEYGNPGGVTGFWSYRFICKPADGHIHEIIGESYAGHQWSEQTKLTLVSAVSAVKQNEIMPETVRLRAPYPNPSRSSFWIQYAVTAPEDIRLSVHDRLGRTVAVLSEGRKEPGQYTVLFDCGKYSPGVYYVHLHSGGSVQSRTVVVLQ